MLGTVPNIPLQKENWKHTEKNIIMMYAPFHLQMDAKLPHLILAPTNAELVYMIIRLEACFIAGEAACVAAEQEAATSQESQYKEFSLDLGRMLRLTANATGLLVESLEAAPHFVSILKCSA